MPIVTISAIFVDLTRKLARFVMPKFLDFCHWALQHLVASLYIKLCDYGNIVLCREIL